MRDGIKINGIRDFQKYLDRQPAIATKAASLAINDVTRKFYTKARKKILSDVSFTASYLDGAGTSSPRLQITQLANESNLKSTIRGRQRATSLARFDPKQLYGPAKSGGRKKSGVSVKVGNSRKKIPNAFLLNLKRGTADSGNVGLAIRVPAGEPIKNKKIQGRPLGGSGNRTDDVYLLYGPSVQQVFGRVATELLPSVNQALDTEFRRQFARLSGGQ